MPYYTFKEIWTPLKIAKISFYRCIEDNTVYIKVGKSSRKKLIG